MQQLERIPKAAARMGVSTAHVYREVRAGRLGPIVKLGPRASALPQQMVSDWIAARILESQQNQGGEK